MKYYLQRSIAGVYKVENAIDDPEQHKGAAIDGYPFGTTFADYLDGHWITLTEDRIAFYEANPTATPAEIIAMQLTPEPRTPSKEEQAEAEARRIEQAAKERIEADYPIREVLDRLIELITAGDEAPAANAYLTNYVSRTTSIRQEALTNVGANNYSPNTNNHSPNPADLPANNDSPQQQKR